MSLCVANKPRSKVALRAKLSHSARNRPTLFYTSSMATSNPSPEQPVTAVTWEVIVAAHERIKPRIHRTPVLTSSSIDAIAGAQIFFKCDNFQKTGSFKIRGATNAVFSLTDSEVAQGIITLSSCNHGAAIAAGGAWRGVKTWVVMPRNAPTVKFRAVEGYGAQITLCEPTMTSRS